MPAGEIVSNVAARPLMLRSATRDPVARQHREARVGPVLPNLNARRDALLVQQLRQPLGEIVEHADIFAFAAALAPVFEIMAAPGGRDGKRAPVAEFELHHRFARRAQLGLEIVRAVGDERSAARFVHARGRRAVGRARAEPAGCDVGANRIGGRAGAIEQDRQASCVADVAELDQPRTAAGLADDIERRIGVDRFERDALVRTHIDLQRILLRANIFVGDGLAAQNNRACLRRLVRRFKP